MAGCKTAASHCRRHGYREGSAKPWGGDWVARPAAIAPDQGRTRAPTARALLTDAATGRVSVRAAVTVSGAGSSEQPARSARLIRSRHRRAGKGDC